MKKLLALVLTIATLLSLCAGFGGSAQTANLLTIDEETSDDIFESGYMVDYVENCPAPALGSWVDGGENIEGGWFPSDYMFFDTETVKYGTRSIRIKPSKDHKHIYVSPIMDASELTAGKTYTFSCYVKTNKLMAMDGGGADLNIVFWKKTHAVIEETGSGMALSGTKDWTQMSITFTMPEVEDAFVQFCMRSWVAMSGTVWFDGMALVEGDKAFDYAELAPIEAPTPADPTPAPVAPTLNGEPSAWAKEEILKALEADLVPEHVNSNYTTDITRSDFCDLIIKMIEKKSGKAIADVIAGYADAKADVSFPDTDSANVIAAAKLGIVNGRSSGAFDPTANITRQEAAKMLALAAKVLGADITASEVAFADADDIYAWAKEFIYYVNTIGVMNGTSTTTPPNFSPLRTYTREQSILTVYRLFNAL
ncbi:MAG: hypothetical protein E7491_09935 [Ruminococcaceae bacterium]|nr:hypothetical protein [Oscillospiraceae bacterium]